MEGKRGKKGCKGADSQVLKQRRLTHLRRHRAAQLVCVEMTEKARESVESEREKGIEEAKERMRRSLTEAEAMPVDPSPSAPCHSAGCFGDP